MKDTYSTYVMLSGADSGDLTDLSVLEHCVPCGPCPHWAGLHESAVAPLLASPGTDMLI